MYKEGKYPNFFGLFKIKREGQMVDPKDLPEFERKFIYPLSLIGIIFSMISILVNSLWNFNGHLIIGAWLSLVFYTVVFFVVRKAKDMSIIKWVFILATIVFINYGWYIDYRSHGSIIYLLFLLYGYLTFMLDRKELMLVSLILLVNFLTLFFLDYGGYLPAVQYSREYMPMVDSYSSVVLYIFIALVLIRIVKRIYATEYDKALESDRLKTAFLSNMSHEVRTPLNAIIGFSNLMVTEMLSSEERNLYKTYINQNSKFLLALVNDILDISMIESHNLQLNIESCSLNYIISELEEIYLVMLQKQGASRVKLFVDVPKKDVSLDIDKKYLEQALNHLLDNAVKFTDQGHITFGYTLEDKHIRFFVKDTGIGIKEDEVPNLFERFNKLEYSKEKVFSGAGIGLYLVRLIVEMFGGEVSVKSTFGVGSDFYFTIPAKKHRSVIIPSGS